MATVDVLAELGYQVDMLCYPLGNSPQNRQYTIFRSYGPASVQSVKIGPSPQKVLLDIPLAWSARKLVRKYSYDVIHGVEEAGFIACWLGKRYGIPYIFDMHSWMSQQIEDGKFLKIRFLLDLFKKLELYAMKNARAIITVGEEMTSLLRTKLVPDVYSVSLPDRSLSLQDSVSQETIRSIEERFFRQPGKKILYTGNFHQYQGIDLLLDSIQELKKQGGLDCQLLLVGGGDGEREKVEFYKEMCRTKGIADSVIFCGEFPPETMSVFIEKSDVLVSSRITGNNIPLKIYTYLASGKLLVATNIASHTQVLHSGNCLLAEPDPAAFARELQRALCELTDSEKERIAEEAKKSSGQEHFQKFTDILANCYTHCLKRPLV